MKRALAFSLIVLFLYNTCVSPTENIDGTNSGRRDYVWSIDTLDASDNFYYNLWGSSPSDVWTVTSSNWEKSIYHFNGDEWVSNQVNRLFNMRGLYGFSYDNIFVGADNGSIWRFDGNNWELFSKLQKEGADYFLYQNIWGESSNDFYAVGAGPDENGFFNISVINHYYEGEWEILNTNELVGNVVQFYQNESDRKKYFSLIKIGGAIHPDSTIIYELKNSGYLKLYSSEEIHGKQAFISQIDKQVYFIMGNRIAIRKNDEFITVLDVNNSNFYQRIWGRNSKDLFLLMTDGLVHYNGVDLEYLFYFNVTPQTQIYGAALFDKEVFFLVDEFRTRKRLIYHGILD